MRREFSSKGFTLFEVAIVVLIITMSLTMGLSALNGYLAKEAITLTQQRQQGIKDALIGFLMKNKRLPCPDVNFDGIESSLDWTAATPQQCLNLWGPIPFLSLGLSKEIVFDGWANPFDYYVSPNWAFDVSGKPFKLDADTNAPGLIAVNTRVTANSATLPIATSTAPPYNGAVVAIVSHGPNGAGAFSLLQTTRVAAINGVDVDEIANAPGGRLALTPVLVPSGVVSPGSANVINGGPALIIRDANLNADNTVNVGGIFDDVVLIVRREEFVVPLTKSGITQPIESQLTAAFQQAQSELIGFVRTNATPGALCSCMPAPPATTCTCSSSSQANNLPPDTCSHSPCTLPIPSAADPCSNATPPTKISYRILYDINRPSCGGPALMTNTAVSTLLDVNDPITAGSCSTSLSTGGGGAVFTSICNGATNSPNPLSKSFLGGIQ